MPSPDHRCGVMRGPEGEMHGGDGRGKRRGRQGGETEQGLGPGLGLGPDTRVDRLISWPVGKGGKETVQKCKGETEQGLGLGLGLGKREARRLRGLVEQREASFRVAGGGRR